jgi:hypothetical protein
VADPHATPDRAAKVSVELAEEMAVYLRHTPVAEWNYDAHFALDAALDKALGDGDG